MIRNTIYRLGTPLAIALAACTTSAPAQMHHDTDGTLQVDMRKLWEDHVSWTRMYIISAVSNAPDKAATLDRLMKNQDDIGNAVKPFYGDSAGQKLTALLKDHIRIAGEVVDAAAKSDKPRVEDASKRWGLNADQLATFLAAANPANWKVDDLKMMLHQHLDLTTQEVTAYLGKDWKGSIDTYDKVRDQALQMADALSAGIMKQFPQKAAM
jgi:hypothetical protein